MNFDSLSSASISMYEMLQLHLEDQTRVQTINEGQLHARQLYFTLAMSGPPSQAETVPGQMK